MKKYQTMKEVKTMALPLIPVAAAVAGVTVVRMGFAIYLHKKIEKLEKEERKLKEELRRREAAERTAREAATLNRVLRGGRHSFGVSDLFL